ncbi:hypothetical protein H6P81_015556 [Aristolochia fimbriata]|uniref:Uncharacterized protein n=1 Tax=Aristolochia fimbriata TaxID=158543 RepID=A0AAV7E756_ARIFI|nr:hypothetical protein H6P81_015556 [Aristolochia fimbriata]
MASICVQETQLLTPLPPPPPPFPHFEALEKLLNYRFKNRELLEQAMTHGSWQQGSSSDSNKNYERLEFIGDSVLSMLIAREMLTCYPELSPGPLTALRAANVDTEKLGRVAMRHELYRYLRHRAPPLETQVKDFKKAMKEYPTYSSGLIDTPKFLADIVESLIGAVSIDCSYCLDTVWKAFKELLEPVIRPDTYQKDPTSELHEFCQKRGWKVQLKNTWSTDAKITVTIFGHYVASAGYANRRETAQKRAAKAALDTLTESVSLQELLDREKEALDKAKQGAEASA